MQELRNLRLGSDARFAKYKDNPADWAPAQKLEQQRVARFLGCLVLLEAVRVRLEKGGPGQLMQLLQQGSFATCLQRLEIIWGPR